MELIFDNDHDPGFWADPDHEIEGFRVTFLDGSTIHLQGHNCNHPIVTVPDCFKDIFHSTFAVQIAEVIREYGMSDEEAEDYIKSRRLLWK